MRISEWSSDVCSSDLRFPDVARRPRRGLYRRSVRRRRRASDGRTRAAGRYDRCRRRDGRTAGQLSLSAHVVEGAAAHFRAPFHARAPLERGLNLRILSEQNVGMPATGRNLPLRPSTRSEEHTSELQSLMRNSYAVFCLKKKNTTTN